VNTVQWSGKSSILPIGRFWDGSDSFFCQIEQYTGSCGFDAKNHAKNDQCLEKSALGFAGQALRAAHRTYIERTCVRGL